MPTSFGLLLRSSILRGEQESKDKPPRNPPRYQRPHSSRVARPVAMPLSSLRPSPLMYTSRVPAFVTNQAQMAFTPGLWTRYGRWNAAGTCVFNQGGEVIYELP